MSRNGVSKLIVAMINGKNSRNICVSNLFFKRKWKRFLSNYVSNVTPWHSPFYRLHTKCGGYCFYRCLSIQRGVYLKKGVSSEGSPPSEGRPGIWSIRGRCASYWNAFLLQFASSFSTVPGKTYAELLSWGPINNRLSPPPPNRRELAPPPEKSWIHH